MYKSGFESNTVKIWTRLVNTVCIIVILVCIVMPGTVARLYFGGSGNGNSTASTVKREALPTGSVNETAYYTEDAYLEDKIVIEKGLKHFYQVTGVQPYVDVIVSLQNNDNPTERDIAAYARPLYSQLFTDESHLLLVFYFDFEWHDFEYYIVTGSKAKTVIDSEAEEILADFIKFYFDDMSISEEMFSNAFSDAGDRIMGITQAPSGFPVFITLGALASLILLFVLLMKARKKKRIRAQQNKEILGMPLEQFGAEAAGKAAAPAQNYGSVSATGSTARPYTSPAASPFTGPAANPYASLAARPYTTPSAVSYDAGAVTAQEAHIKRLLDENAAETAKYADLAREALKAGKENDARIFIEKKRMLETAGEALDTAYDNVINMRRMQEDMMNNAQYVQPRQMINVKTTVAKNGKIINETSCTVGNPQGAAGAFNMMDDEMGRMFEQVNSMFAQFNIEPIFGTPTHTEGSAAQVNTAFVNVQPNTVPKDEAEILAEKYASQGSKASANVNALSTNAAEEKCRKQRAASADEELADLKADLGL